MKRVIVLRKLLAIPLAAILLSPGILFAGSVTVTNPSFEAPVVGDGNTGGATGWTGGNVYDPLLNQVAGGTYCVPDDPTQAFIDGIPDGVQVGWSNGSDFHQTTGTTFVEGNSYTLTVHVGGRCAGLSGQAYRVEILADGAAVASEGGVNLANSWFEQSVHYVAVADVDGMTLGIGLFNDGAEQVNWDLVTLVSNAPPVAEDDSFTLLEGGSLTDNVITNTDPNGADSDADGDTLTATLGTAPAHHDGTFTLGADGGFTYTPTADYCGSDSFTYTVNDGEFDSGTATASITVTCVNDAPSFTAHDYDVDEDAGLQSGIVIGDGFDPGPDNESDQTLLQCVVTHATGVGDLLVGNDFSVSIGGTENNECHLSFTPVDDAFGSFYFDLAVRDSGGTANGGVNISPEQFVTITINPKNDPPVITSIADGTEPFDAQTVDYSDTIEQVVITVTDIDSSTQDLALSASPLPSNLEDPAFATTAVCTVGSPSITGTPQSCTFTMDGTVLDPAEPFAVVFEADDGAGEYNTNVCSEAPNVCNYTLTVEAEHADAMLDNGNDTDAMTEPGKDSGTFYLSFSAWEISSDDDPPVEAPLHDGGTLPGDLNNMLPYMTLVPVGPGGPEPGLCSLDGIDDTGYDQVANFTCEFSGVPVNTYEIDAGVEGGYYAGSTEGVFVVYDPSLGFTTGGGFFFWPNTCEVIEGGILNGSFEDPAGCGGAGFNTLAAGGGGLSDWVIGGDSVDLICSYWDPAEGAQSLDMTGLYAGTITQTLSGLEIGGFYEVSFMMSGNPDPSLGDIRRLQVDVGGVTETFDFDVENDCGGACEHGNMGWTQQSVQFQAMADTVDLVFTGVLENYGWGPAIDDIKLLGPRCNDAYMGDKTNFGFNFKYNKKQKNIQGSLLMMRHTPMSTWKVKSNAIDGMGLGSAEDDDGPYGWAAVTGKATFRDPTEYNTGGNAFLFYVEDHGEQGCGQVVPDEIWVEVDAENIWPDPLGREPVEEDGSDGADEAIFCGNIVVPHETTSKGKKPN